MSFSTPLIILVLAIVVAQLGPLFLVLRPFDSIQNEDLFQSCDLIGDKLLSTSEDLAIYRWGKLFVSDGNLKHFAGKGAFIPNGEILKSNIISPGKMAMVNLLEDGNSCVQTIPVDNMPKNIAFFPHGIHYSNSSNSLYVISHGLADGGSGVFVFDVNDDTSDSLPTQCDGTVSSSIRLEFVRYVTSPLFQNIGINDVTEGLISDTQSEFYVTKWLQFPAPLAGKDHPVGLKEILHSVAQELIMVDLPENFAWLSSRIYQLLGLEQSRASVIRCVWDKTNLKDQTNHCEVVVSGLIAANGITTTPDRSKIYVNELALLKVHEYERQVNGSLTETAVIDIPYMPDNVEYDLASGDLFIGSIPTPLTSLKAMKGLPVNAPGLPVHAPGGLMVLHKEENGQWVTSTAKFHDGSLLSQISAAIQHGNKVVMGSPLSPGVVICDV